MLADKAISNNTGMYHPEFEHDACGLGFVANIKGQKSCIIIVKFVRTFCRFLRAFFTNTCFFY